MPRTLAAAAAAVFAVLFALSLALPLDSARAAVAEHADPAVTVGQVSPAPEPSEPGAIDTCALLTESEVEEVTGLDARPGVMKEIFTGAVGCGFGTEPYEVQIDVTISDSGPAVVGLGLSGVPIDGLGEGAQWLYCEECLSSDGGSSTNMLVIADGLAYVFVRFGATTDEASGRAAREEATQRVWAVELARLILPRVAASLAPAPAPASPAPSAAAPEPSAAAPIDPPAVAPLDGAVDDGGAGPGPGAFAASVPRPAQVSMDPLILLQSAGLAALLIFFMPFPSQLFNSTLEAHEDDVRRWLRLDRIGSVVGGLGAFWGTWPGLAIFTFLAALLYGFLDPGFGFTLESLATFIGMLLGIVLVTAVFAVPVVLAHRRLGDRWTLKVVPVSLLIGVACVLLSRLTDFQPGYLYGLLIGLAFARELSAADEGRATAFGAGLMLAVALAAWLGLGALPDGDAFGLVILRTTLAALMVAGLEGVVFGLLPMRFLPGEQLYAWNRVLWGALLAVGAFAFFHILINPASGYLSDTSRTPLLTVVGLLVGFSLLSIAFWAWFRFRGEPVAARDV